MLDKIIVVLSDGSTYDTASECELWALTEDGHKALVEFNDAKGVEADGIESRNNLLSLIKSLAFDVKRLTDDCEEYASECASLKRAWNDAMSRAASLEEDLGSAHDALAESEDEVRVLLDKYEVKRADKYACAKCGSELVKYESWVWANGDTPTGEVPSGKQNAWCDECCAATTIIRTDKGGANE